MRTHDVTNQPPVLADYDVAQDPALLAGLHAFGAGWAEPELHEVGRRAGSSEVAEMARVVNEHPPVLRSHDRFGNRIDEVEFHPYWHELMRLALAQGLHAPAWRTPRRSAHTARTAKFLVWGQGEAGHLCPVSMTYAVVPALRHSPDLAGRFEPLLASTVYDFGLRDPQTKQGLVSGMSMTEKQGGSDVRVNTTTARPRGDGTFGLVGHKWFTSAPMSDLFLVLAQAPGGLSCFFVPRVLPGGDRNAVRVQRLKDKLGNRSNASAEVEYEDATGWLVGEEGRGVRTIMEMVSATRLDAMTGSAAGMRWGVVQALHHARHRRAFGSPLVDQPLMANVLSDLVVESEAATLLSLRVAAATDHAAAGDEAESAFRRLALPVAKYWICKRAPAHAAEALECLGGNGYVEESQMPRLYREAPLNSIWEGSGNVAALDALRAMATRPECMDAFVEEVSTVAGEDARLDHALEMARKELVDADELEVRARRIVERLALVLQASLLVRHGAPAVADAFISSRLAGDRGGAFGGLPPRTDRAAVLGRAMVEGHAAGGGMPPHLAGRPVGEPDLLGVLPATNG
ncbi:MAG TPA: acyl-CoA dehydrogenase family protein [Acidimicrobiales bacterium]|nr:acyl-CoA dehydrogenase family protein [Acidimicrobiales bacterium]